MGIDLQNGHYMCNNPAGLQQQKGFVLNKNSKFDGTVTNGGVTISYVCTLAKTLYVSAGTVAIAIYYGSYWKKTL